MGRFVKLAHFFIELTGKRADCGYVVENHPYIMVDLKGRVEYKDNEVERCGKEWEKRGQLWISYF